MYMKKGASLIIACCAILCLSSCGYWDRLRVFEKNVELPSSSWQYDFKPAFDVEIRDTVSTYNIYVTVRHTDAYRFSNLWLLIHTQYPGDTLQTQRVELPLADEQGRWLGSGIDDIFEHRIPIQQKARFDKAGIYHFSFEQNMRLNPLQHILSIGLRIEKANP